MSKNQSMKEGDVTQETFGVVNDITHDASSKTSRLDARFNSTQVLG